jgi:hypothetical protein
MKLLITEFSPTSYDFIPLRSKYSPQHPVLKPPQSMFFPWCQRLTARSDDTGISGNGNLSVSVSRGQQCSHGSIFSRIVWSSIWL